MSLQPQWDRSMRTGVRSRRIGNEAVRRRARSSSGRMRSGLVGGVADAEHPLVAAHRADAAPHLVGQRLEAPGRGRRPPGRCRAASLGPLRRAARRGTRRSPRRTAAAAGGRSPRTGCSPAAGASAEARPAGGSGGSRRGRTGPGRARRGCRSARGSARGRRTRRAGAPPAAPRRASSSERSRTAGSAAVMIVVSLAGPLDGSSCGHRLRGQLALRQQLDQARQDLLAVVAVQRQGELGDQQAVLDADVVPPPAHLQGQVPLARGEFGQGRREGHRGPRRVPLWDRPPRLGPATSLARRSITAGVRTCMPKKQR